MAEIPHAGPAAEAQLRFRDEDRARRNLADIGARVPPSVAAAIPALLADAPDPDTALNLFERLSAAASPELFRLFDRHRAMIHYALLIFGYSQYLGETLISNPDLFHALHREGALDRSHSREEFREGFARFRSRSFENDISVLLARYKRREYVRIMLRDVLGIATLAEIAGEVSSLSDVLIEEALRETESAYLNRYGTPQTRDSEDRIVDVPLTVLSLGKLGGNELNYSSDIDLLFLYGDGENPGSPRISNREYFIRLAQTVTDVLSRITQQGPVFRVDLRLRPQGGQGEPAVSLGHALGYYEHAAADWELQAMIKVRHSAGEQELARRFIRAVQPYVYRSRQDARLNFVAIETALATREKIGAHRQASSRRGIDVKLDPGGIRDVEFLVQCLQRVYGGSEPWLRSGGTLFSLQKLHDKGHISGREFHELTTAYEFLRKIEHRLQIRFGQQTHRLPGTPEDLAILARSVEPQAASHDAQEFSTRIESRMAAVSAIYQRIIHGAQQEQQPSNPEFHLAEAQAGREHSERQMLQRLSQDAPALYEIARGAASGSTERRNLFRFLSAAFTTSDRYAAIVKSPQGLERAMRLFELSDFATELLLRHPDEIATLDRIDAPSPRGSERLFDGETEVRSSDAVFDYTGRADLPYGEKLRLLRQRFRRRVFASAARDIIESRPVFESLAESTHAADEAISAALASINPPGGLAVCSLGRLGTAEFDLLSDADLIFLRDEDTDPVIAAKAAEQFIQAVSAYTRDGTVFAVDPRLRPRGTQGELVSTPAQLLEYFQAEAEPWEALTYTKLRPIAGSQAVSAAGVQAAVALTRRFGSYPEFPLAVREMRVRLEERGEFNLKTSPGAIYDIDFIATFLAVRSGLAPLNVNIRERLQALRDRGALEPGAAAALMAAAELFRSVEHVIRLVTGRPRKTLPVGEHARRATVELARAILRRDFDGGLDAELRRTAAETRVIFDHLVM